MNRLGRIVLQVSACSILVLLTTPAMAGAPFSLDCAQPYANVDVGVTSAQLVFDLRTPLSSSDQVYVQFDYSNVPESWLVQWCDSHSGVCYPGDATISIPGNNVPDEIQVDFYPEAGDAQKAWINFYIYRVNDPSTYREVTIALGHGVILPVPNYSFRANPAFKNGNPTDIVLIPGVIRSNNAWDDHLIVSVTPDMPNTWFAQFCQNSTGVCYIAGATIPFHAGILDTLEVDFYTGPDPGVGHYRMKTQSAANPAFWQAIPFGVMTGNVPSAVGDGPALDQFAVRTAPNPLRTQTDFMVSSANPSTVRLLVVDANGRQVLSRMETFPSAGVNRIRWDARDETGRSLPNGTYFYRVGNGKEEARGKVIITK
jgi:hypothetical protein